MDDAPDELLEQARRRVRGRRAEEEYDEQGKRLARRIVVAFGLIALSGTVFFVILPSMGLWLPPVVPLASFAVIVIGSVLTHRAEAPAVDDDSGPIDIQASERDRSLPGRRE